VSVNLDHEADWRRAEELLAATDLTGRRS